MASHRYDPNAYKSTDSHLYPTEKSVSKSKSIDIRRAVKIFAKKQFRLTEKYIDMSKNKYLYFLIRHEQESIDLLIDVRKYNFVQQRDALKEYSIHEYREDLSGLESNLIEQDQEIIKQIYDEVEQDNNIPPDEKDLYENYNKEISLKGKEEKHKINLNAIRRQQKRFAMTVKNLAYQIVIFQDNWLVLNDKEEIMHSYYVKGKKENKVCLMIDLEFFFSQDGITDDVTSVFTQFYRILDDNQTNLAKRIQKLINNKLDILGQSQTQEKKKNNLISQLKSQKQRLDAFNTNERRIYKELDKLHIKTGKNEPLSDDLLTQKVRYQDELDEIIRERTILLSDIQDTRVKLDRITLVTDKVFFEILLLLIHTHKFVDMLKEGI